MTEDEPLKGVLSLASSLSVSLPQDLISLCEQLTFTVPSHYGVLADLRPRNMEPSDYRLNSPK